MVCGSRSRAAESAGPICTSCSRPQGIPLHPAAPWGTNSSAGCHASARLSRACPEGRRVAVAPNVSCGLCAKCKAGRPNHCADFTTLGIFRDGGLAQYCVAPERACHALADHLRFDDAVWIEVLSCVVNSVDTVRAL